MPLRRWGRFPSVVGVALAVSGCAAQTVQVYDGAPRPAAQTAVVRGAFRYVVLATWRVFIVAVDGKSVTSAISVAVLPGSYVFTTTYQGMTGTIVSKGEPVDVRFTVEPGREYEIRPLFLKDDKWLVEVVETTTGAKIPHQIIPAPRAAL